MKYIAACLLALSVHIAYGQSASLWSGYRSKYLFSNGANICDAPVVQFDLFLLSKKGLMAELWCSMPLDAGKIGKDFTTETELIVGWMGTVKGYDLTLSAAYYDLYPVFSFEKTDYILLPLEVSKSFKFGEDFTVSPFIHAEVNFRLDGYECGITLPRVGTRYSWKINRLLSLCGKAMVVYDPGIIGGDEAYIGSFESSLIWKAGKHLNVEFPFVRFVEPLTRVTDGRKSDVIWGFGLTYRF